MVDSLLIHLFHLKNGIKKAPCILCKMLFKNYNAYFSSSSGSKLIVSVQGTLFRLLNTSIGIPSGNALHRGIQISRFSLLYMKCLHSAHFDNTIIFSTYLHIHLQVFEFLLEDVSSFQFLLN